MIKNNENFKEVFRITKILFYIISKSKKLSFNFIITFSCRFLNIIGFTLLVPLLDIFI